MILDPNNELSGKKNLRLEFAKKNFWLRTRPMGKFLLLMVLTTVKLSHILNQILSKDFKFHEKYASVQKLQRLEFKKRNKK
jgi:hypothetical protein